MTTLAEDQLLHPQNPEGSKAGSHQENHANIHCQLYLFMLYVYLVFSLYQIVVLKSKTHGPSGLRAEALGIFFWQMVISN